VATLTNVLLMSIDERQTHGRSTSRKVSGYLGDSADMAHDQVKMLCTSLTAAIEKLVGSALDHCTPQPHLLGILGLYIHGNGSQGITVSKGRSGTAQDEQQQGDG
jgi:hypothetical protein